MKVSSLAGSQEFLILIRGCDRIPMCIQLLLPLHGRIYTGGRLFTIGPSSTAVKLSFVLIVSLATLPFRVRYSWVTVCVPVTWVPCGETVSSLAGTSASTGSPSPPDMISPGLVGWIGMMMSAIFRVDGRDRRVRMDRACFRPQTCVANPFRNCLLAQKENHRKEKSWFAANVSPACSFLVYLLKMKVSSLAGFPF